MNDINIFKGIYQHKEIVGKYLADIKAHHPDITDVLSNYEIEEIITMHLDVALNNVLDGLKSKVEIKKQHKKLWDNADAVIRFISLVNQFKAHTPTLIENEVTTMMQLIGINKNEKVSEDEDV